MDDTKNLDGHVALITGAGRRLGRAFAETLAARGADVAVHFGGDSKGAQETVAAARSQGVKAQAFQADLNDPHASIELVRQVAQGLGPADILVNSASIFEAVEAAECSLESWQRHLAINLTAPFLLSQAFARQLDGGPGTIVNLLDWRALRPGPDHFPYTISKSGLAAMTLSLAQSFAPRIRVNGLALGAILPPPGQTEKTEEPIRQVPLARWGEVEEVCQALLFLIAGPDYVTGQILHVDGGRHLT